MNIFRIFIFSLLLSGVAITAYALNRSEVEKNLICYACPGEALNIDRCSGGNQMRAEIDRRLALGEDKQTILNFFVQQFGEDILTVPPQRGFNLVAYAAPFVALLIGLVIAGMLIWKWGAAGRSGTGAGEHDAESEALYRKMEDQVEDELKKLEDD
ncbi:MAG: cytochrome c-type biogenesis protein CcmH [Desulfobulbaceae bacterium]|nr:cytochrome c-type biogenesis protein CcmH [Desulfobulbaceae bacterium]